MQTITRRAFAGVHETGKHQLFVKSSIGSRPGQVLSEICWQPSKVQLDEFWQWLRKSVGANASPIGRAICENSESIPKNLGQHRGNYGFFHFGENLVVCPSGKLWHLSKLRLVFDSREKWHHKSEIHEQNKCKQSRDGRLQGFTKQENINYL